MAKRNAMQGGVSRCIGECSSEGRSGSKFRGNLAEGAVFQPPRVAAKLGGQACSRRAELRLAHDQEIFSEPFEQNKLPSGHSRSSPRMGGAVSYRESLTRM